MNDWILSTRRRGEQDEDVLAGRRDHFTFSFSFCLITSASSSLELRRLNNPILSQSLILVLLMLAYRDGWCDANDGECGVGNEGRDVYWILVWAKLGKRRAQSIFERVSALIESKKVHSRSLLACPTNRRSSCLDRSK